jgi:hypothetical protein
MLGELAGTDCPDPFADAISYHEWFEDNKCPCCDGRGWRLYNVRGRDPMEHECQCCDGSALKGEDWECTGFDHSEYE